MLCIRKASGDRICQKWQRLEVADLDDLRDFKLVIIGNLATGDRCCHSWQMLEVARLDDKSHSKFAILATWQLMIDFARIGKCLKLLIWMSQAALNLPYLSIWQLSLGFGKSL